MQFKRGIGALFAPRGKGTVKLQKKNTKMHFEAHFLLFLLAVWRKKITKGVNKNFFETWGVNEVSCRRGDSDFTLQEGGNDTLPPCPCMGSPLPGSPKTTPPLRTYLM